MKPKKVSSVCIAVLACAVASTSAEEKGNTGSDTAFPTERVTQEMGLTAWAKIHAVASHPRCTNCHVGADNVPLWTRNPGDPPRAHGMAVNAGESRIGAEGLSCRTCHQTSKRPNQVSNAAPHTGMHWQLAPKEMQWTGKSSTEICKQLRDPDRNGGRDADGLVEHILDDMKETGFITWAFNPGGNREPAPGGLRAHLQDMALWTAAGMPCP
ncbi:hypothetical protein [Roseibium sp. MMSF_3412]|uniref:hypothetical protein n=1 Tax=Roseibium sp. MMSF_3412 TaxID=3046712 RepID=UPI00273FC23D|nr:hypothetical protein [Roseibium sp. MMSF_3412]